MTLFSHLFKLIESTTPKPASQVTGEEEEIQENIMWLINQMVDQAETTSVVKVCLESRVVQIIADHISSDKKETTILQTLLTLQALSKEPELLS
jgi:hypothetical protein